MTLVLLVCLPISTSAYESFDFETPYLVHAELQVWDFCLVQHEGQFHAFYHTIPPLTQHPDRREDGEPVRHRQPAVLYRAAGAGFCCLDDLSCAELTAEGCAAAGGVVVPTCDNADCASVTNDQSTWGTLKSRFR